MERALHKPVAAPAFPWSIGQEFVKPLFEWFGAVGLFCFRMCRAALSPPWEFRELLRQFDEVGAKSALLVALAGAATGVVLSLETRDSLTRFGAESSISAVIIITVIRESGPLITGLVVAGRVGAGIGAELGSMKVTDQIDAMEVSAVNPYKYLSATRILACALMLPLLTLISDICGIVTGWMATTLTSPVSLQLFLDSGLKHVTFNDLIPTTLKTVVFGLIIGIVACFQGMNAKGGTTGVGRAATSSVVLSSLFIILSDVGMVRLILKLFP